MVMSGISLLFYFGGLISPEDNSLLDNLMNINDLSSSDIWDTVLGGLLAVGSGLVIGFVTKDFWAGVVTVIIFPVSMLLWNFVIVFNKVWAFSPVIASIIFAPILFIFMFVMFDWARGLE